MPNIVHKLLILLFFLGCYQTATAGPYEDANAALMRGDGSGALRIMVPLAVRGQGEAQFVVGMLYLQGNGVLQDVDQAVTWLSKAGEKGHIRAQMTLAGLFLDPNSPKRDNEAGIGWYRKAAEAGDASAQTILGQYYRQGFVLSQDFATAAAWFRLAARQFEPRAQFELGELYRNGFGVKQDLARAHMWFNISANTLTNNDNYRVSAARDSAAARQIVGSLLRPDEIAAAEQMATECWQRDLKDCD